jgi:hypothetical protein
MEKPEMPHAGHDRHLCYLTNLGFMAESPHEYLELVKDARFFCKQCGRAARSADNLCKPEKL